MDHDSVNSLKERTWAAVRGYEPMLHDLALCILAHPELGYREERASRWLGEALEGADFQVTYGLAGLPTAFLAKRGQGRGPVVALVAEYDALPEVGHGCGHNLIGPAAVGAALGAAALLPQLEGTICVLGTPAEEYQGQEQGKVKLLGAGLLDELDAVLMMHPQYAFRLPGQDLGYVACELHFRGRPAHAAADPWHGANALDGLLLTFNNINALRQQLRPEVRVHGIVTDGGQAPNIIPQRASARLMVRAPEPETMEAVFARVEDCARAGALASDTEVEVVRVTTVFNTRVNTVLSDLIASNAQLLGIPMKGEPLDTGGSSDFGNLSQAMPAGMFWAGTHPPGLPWHSREVAQASGETMALRAMTDSACILAGVVVDLLAVPEHLERARDEFEAGVERRP